MAPSSKSKSASPPPASSTRNNNNGNNNNNNNNNNSNTKMRTWKVIQRDASFLLVGAIFASLLGWIELNAGDASLRWSSGIQHHQQQQDNDDGLGLGLVDTGYIATTGLYQYLRDHRNVNDWLAFVNTIVGVFGPMLYFVYTLVWQGDYEPVFRYLAISILRSYCGWFTYLPPSSQYLMSNYDFPDIMQCLLKECGDPTEAELNPFVSFFSGHVATLAICSNHAYLHGNRSLGTFGHLFQFFQITRLLATRGHYSIDIIIGWFMAVYVSNPAGRIGRHFSRATYKSVEELLLPTSGVEAFESLIGVNDVREQRRMSVILKDPTVKEAIQQLGKKHNLDGDVLRDRDTLNAVIDLKLAEEFEHEKPEHTLKMYAEGKIDITTTMTNEAGEHAQQHTKAE